jgi:hypothetical protein
METQERSLADLHDMKWLPGVVVLAGRSGVTPLHRPGFLLGNFNKTPMNTGISGSETPSCRDIL